VIKGPPLPAGLGILDTGWYFFKFIVNLWNIFLKYLPVVYVFIIDFLCYINLPSYYNSKSIIKYTHHLMLKTIKSLHRVQYFEKSNINL
jgi:hypothetical protein